MIERGVTIWLTGLPASGKSTLAVAMQARFLQYGRQAVVLDGDVLRKGLNSDLGFSDNDRFGSCKRAAQVAALLNDSFIDVVVALISPFHVHRQKAQDVIGEHRFIEVFVDTRVEICKQRDFKGNYAKAEAGELKDFTGVDGRYDKPENPAVHVGPAMFRPAECVQKIWDVISKRESYQ